jgi:hypothetical protein
VANKLLVPPDSISGLRLQWDSATVLRCMTGAAYIPSRIENLAVTTEITKTLPTVTANTRYYVYLYHNGTNPDIEISAQAPVTTTYAGKARIKGPDATPDNTRRYIGMILANAAGTGMYKFRHFIDDTFLYYEDLTTAPFQVLTDGRSTTEVNVSCAAVVPPHCRLAELWAGSWGGGYTNFGSSEDNITPAPNSWDTSGAVMTYMAYTGGNLAFTFRMWLDASQQFNYRYSAAPTANNGWFIYVRGYQEVR